MGRFLSRIEFQKYNTKRYIWGNIFIRKAENPYKNPPGKRDGYQDERQNTVVEEYYMEENTPERG